MKKNYKYKAFISYSHKDKKFAKWLHKRIENYKIPKSLREKYPHLPDDLKRSVFRDEEELPTASELSDNLLYAMDNSELFIVVCSPSSVKSRWVNSEIQYYKHKHGENSVLAIIKDGEPNATDIDDAKNEAFPTGLRYKVNQEGNLTQDRTEPIAGDARSYWDREMALMKMIAGILKVDFADLWEREKRERNKRRIIFFTILTVFVALAFYASTQFAGNKINIELENIKTDIALIEYNIRHDNLTQETIIELNKELKKLKELKKVKEDTQKSLGTLKTSLGREAQVAYKSKGAKEAIKILTSREALSRKEQLKKELSLEDITLAKLYVEIHDYVKAKKSYEEAISLFYDYENVMEYGRFLHTQNEYDKEVKLYNELLKKKLTQRQERDIYRFIVYSLYKKKTVNIEETKEKNILLKRYLKKSLKLARKVVEKQSTDDIYILSMLLKDNGVFYTNKTYTFKDGQAGVDKQIYNKVETYFEESLELNKKLLNIDKDNNDFHSLYATTLFNQGKLYSRVSTYDKAQKLYYKSLSVYEKLMIKNSQIYGSSIEGVLSQIYWMIYLMNLTDTEAREKAYLDMLTKYRNLAKKSPSVYCTHYKSVTFKIAQNYEKDLAFKKAELIYKKAFNVCSDDSVFNKFVIEQQLINLYTDSKQLSELEKTYKNLQHNKNLRYTNEGVILGRLASMYSEFNKFDQAEQFYKKEVEYYKKELEYYKNNNQNYMQKISNSLIAYAYESLGGLYRKYQKFDLAFSSYEEALLIFKNLAKTDPNKYEGGAARILSLLGNISFKRENYKKAEIFYKESIHIYKKLVLIKPQQYMIALATVIDTYSIIYINSNKFKTAIKINRELISALKKVQFIDFLKKNEFRSIEAFTLVRIGSLYKEDKQVDNAEKTLMEALALYKELSKFKAHAYKKEIAFIYKELGGLYSSKSENKKSKQFYMDSLLLYKDLAKKEPNIYNVNVAYQLDMLGQLYEEFKQFKEAKEVYMESLSIYKNLATKNPGAYNNYIAWILGRLGEVYKSIDNFDMAIEMHTEALMTYEKSKNKTTQIYRDIAWNLNRTGELYEKTIQYSKAKEVYSKALNTYKYLAKENPNIYDVDIVWTSDKLNVLNKSKSL